VEQRPIDAALVSSAEQGKNIVVIYNKKWKVNFVWRLYNKKYIIYGYKVYKYFKFFFIPSIKSEGEATRLAVLELIFKPVQVQETSG
jgi:hypothetical protein